MSKVVVYIIAKTISIVLISLLFTLLHYLIIIIIQAFTKGTNVDGINS